MEHKQNAGGGARRGAALFRGVAVLLALALAMPLGSAGARAAETGVTGMEQTAAKHLVPVGRAVGIKLFADGVMVVGLAQVDQGENKTSPARSCGLKTGDVITHINSEEVSTIEEVQQALQACGGSKLTIRALRGEQQLQLTATPAENSQGTYQLGAWIRDSMAGIGTVTWYDPDTGCFGALGHGINDVDTALLMPLQSGGILAASVSGVQKGVQGQPGELHGAFEVTRDLGVLTANTDSGVFGTLSDPTLAQGQAALEVAQRSQVKTGPATILSNVSGETVEEYAVELVHVYPENEQGRDLMLRVTDQRLLDATGGIVQGMSGSPILQNGRIVGAVTHVLVNDPTRGYGILAETMLETAQQVSGGAA
jgi:stage IV sporulation protein B